MKTLYLILFIANTLVFSLTSSIGQTSNPNHSGNVANIQSELLDFNYGGYGDTCFAFLEGIVYEQQGSKRKPLDSVQIISYKPLPIDTIDFTNNEGRFLSAFCKGTFIVLIKKKGYQTIKLINYESDPDQVSRLEAILRKGTGEQVFDVSKMKYNK